MSTIVDGQDIEQTFGYVDTAYLDALGQRASGIKHYAYAVMKVGSGKRVLDIGCGPAIDTIALARLVGPTGHVVGVDHDPHMIAIARHRAQVAGIEQWTDHIQGDAAHLPFAQEEFHAVHAERVFMHLRNPEEAVHEMVRVTQPGGRVVVYEPDWGTLSIAAEDVTVERRYVRLWAESLANGYGGRRLKELFLHQQLTDVVVEAFAIQFTEYQLFQQLFLFAQLEAKGVREGVLQPDEIARWHHALECADAKGAFFATCISLMVSGTKRQA